MTHHCELYASPPCLNSKCCVTLTHTHTHSTSSFLLTYSTALALGLAELHPANPRRSATGAIPMESQTFQASAKAGPRGVSPALYTLALTATSHKTAASCFTAGLIRPAGNCPDFICCLKLHDTHPRGFITSFSPFCFLLNMKILITLVVFTRDCTLERFFSKKGSVRITLGCIILSNTVASVLSE